ncbi:hypothetical protein [Blastococcus colisei]|nr:hypothetical protein [Blastococcus colisei]
MISPPNAARRPDRLPPDVVGRLRHWVRTCLRLDDEVVVSVAQLACPDAGCAPVETVLAVLTPKTTVHRTIPLPADRITVADVQAAFAIPVSSGLDRSAS